MKTFTKLHFGWIGCILLCSPHADGRKLHGILGQTDLCATALIENLRSGAVSDPLWLPAHSTSFYTGAVARMNDGEMRLALGGYVITKHEEFFRVMANDSENFYMRLSRFWGGEVKLVSDSDSPGFATSLELNETSRHMSMHGPVPPQWAESAAHWILKGLGPLTGGKPGIIHRFVAGGCNRLDPALCRFADDFRHDLFHLVFSFQDSLKGIVDWKGELPYSDEAARAFLTSRLDLGDGAQITKINLFCNLALRDGGDPTILSRIIFLVERIESGALLHREEYVELDELFPYIGKLRSSHHNLEFGHLIHVYRLSEANSLPTK
jgi:hypothetical protein